MPVSRECLEARTTEPKHVREFLGSLKRQEPTATGGELRFACTGTGVSTGGRAHSFQPFSTLRTEDVCTSFFFRECLDLCTTDNRP